MIVGILKWFIMIVLLVFVVNLVSKVIFGFGIIR